ncbi:hypothetical protein [Catenulispora yoronensis]|uniref:hypothetical protein n=1 Tax=Catenulispora yoronensis TaxID=450799 RepID=UPI0031D00BA9
MGLQEQLDAFVSKINLVATPGASPGALITAALVPDPLTTGLLDEVAGLTRTTFLLKMLRFGDAALPGPGISIADFLGVAGQVLGGQAMPAISVEMPGPALPGARIPVKELSNQGTAGPGTVVNLNGLTVNEDVPKAADGSLPQQPALGKKSDAGTGAGHSVDDVLSGVPGIVGVVESGSAQLPLSVRLDWTFAVGDRTTMVEARRTAALGIVPPLEFVDLGAGTELTMTIGVTGTVTVQDPVAGITASSELSRSVTVQFPGIAIPRLLGLFTWPLYGTQPAVDRSNPNQDSLLLMLPADSPLSGLDSVSSTVGSVLRTVESAVSLLSAPLPVDAVAPFGSAGDFVAQLSPLLSALSTLAATLAKANLDDYVPVTVVKATAPSDHSSVHGGVADIRPYIWHTWGAFGAGHDHYHDNAQSFLWMAPQGGQTIVYRGSGYQAAADDAGLGSASGTMTLTAGATCLAGIRDFRPAPDAVDPGLSPSAISPVSTAVLEGRFTNETAPTNEGDWAWTNSFEFL